MAAQRPNSPFPLDLTGTRTGTWPGACQFLSVRSLMYTMLYTMLYTIFFIFFISMVAYLNDMDLRQGSLVQIMMCVTCFAPTDTH